MARQLRRVVTGHDPKGKSIVIFDGPSGAPMGSGIADFWVADGAPADKARRRQAQAALTGEEYHAAIKDAAEAGVVGGTIYDGLIATNTDSAPKISGRAALTAWPQSSRATPT